MSDATALQFHLDTPAHWRLAEAQLVISGWLVPAPGQAALDLRARIDDTIYLGIYGLPRPDLAAALPHAHDRAGFTVRTSAWSGARRLALDWHDGVQWREFFHTPLDTSGLPVSAVKPKAIFRTALIYDTLHTIYRHFHRAPWRELRSAAAAALDEVLAHNSDFAGHQNIIGHIENPAPWINATYEKFRVTGWVFGADRPLVRLAATTTAATENRMVYPKDRPDVAAHRQDHAHALKSGFYGLVDLRPNVPSPANLLIFAEDAAGRRELAFARRLHIDRRDEHQGAIPIFKPWLFRRVLAAFFYPRLRGRFQFENWSAARREINRLRADLAASLGGGAPRQAPTVQLRRRDQDPYTRWRWHNRLTPRLHEVLTRDARAALQAGGAPLISVVVPAYNTPEKYLRGLLDCLTAQIYPRWELCIADDASPRPHVRAILEDAARRDPRIKPIYRTENGHISRATNSALAIATGDFVALVDHDDLLPADALWHVAEAIIRHPTAGYLYTDEDKIDDHGRHFDPQFKGDWSPEMAITHNYTHHLTVIRRAIVEQAGRLRPEFNGAQDIDLFLRCFELIDHRDVVHVPFIAYHWRAHAESTAARGDQKGYLFDAARNGIAAALARRGLSAEPVLPDIARHNALCLHQLKWSPSILRDQPVTIVIPSKNRADLLQACLDSLARTTPRASVKVVVVDDNSDDETTLAYLRTLPARADLRVEVLTAPPTAEGFNYSRLVNLGTARADTPLVLHLNNDVTALEPGWLEDMAGWLSVPGVGVVGARLLYPDDTLNHAGIALCRTDGLAHVLFEREPRDEFGTLFLPHAARNVSAVTGACLLTRTALYRELGGFDEVAFQVAYNDVDFCLRAADAGQRCVYTPQATLQHLGSASRGQAYAEREHLAYIARHGGRRDSFISDALQFPPRNLPLNPYHQRYAEQPRPFRALLVTHNLNLEGAPIFLLELARYLATLPGAQITVAALADGPLRTRFAEVGLKVEIWTAPDFSTVRSSADLSPLLAAFAQTRAWDDAEVIIGNTLLTWWVVPLAQHLQRPAALYLHESRPVERFFAASLPPALHAAAAEALTLATRVVFTAQSTHAIHAPHNHHDNYRLLPSWVDFDRIDAFIATHDPAALRRRHDLDPDAVIVTNIGSVCERKGQHIYIRAIELLRSELPTLFPGRKIQWVIVGARDGLYMETLREDIELMGLRDVITIFPETPAIYDFYRLSDLLVCTSFEESFPRVILEGMVFGNRIVSTDVNGIAEMLTHTDEALLVPAGDQHKLAAALKTALTAHSAGDRKMPSMARARAARDYHHARILPRHASVIREAWLG